MKKTKKVLSKLIIIFSIFVCLFPVTSNADLTNEQREKVANFAIGFVTKGNEKGILRYVYGGKTGLDNKLNGEGNMIFDCSAFACFVYNQTCNAGLRLNTAGLNSSPKFRHVGTYNGNINNLLPGDLICRSNDHVVVYVGNGQIAHASTNNAPPTSQVKIANLYSGLNGYNILRYNGTPDTVKGFESYVWPDGTTSQWTDVDIEGYEYNGLQGGSYGAHRFSWYLNKLAEILDWLVGITTYLVRAVFVGWGSVVESLINGIMLWTTGEEASITVEKLLNNQVPMLDVNFFSLETVGGQQLEEDSIMYIIRENIAIWYYIIRTITIAGLLVTLIYLGIRMALATIGEQKAKYKEMLVAWVTSFIIVFFIHYIMIIILNINSSLLELINLSFNRRRRIFI